MLGFETTDEERMLKENVERFVERDYPLDARIKASRDERGYRDEMWRKFAELGWLGLSLPEEVGGFDAGARQSAQVMEAFGSALVTEPYLASVIMAGGAIALAGNEEQKARYLRPLAAGSTKMSLAYAERHSRYDLNSVSTTASFNAGEYLLRGHKSVVLNGDTADLFVVSARTSGSETDRNGISLFAIPAELEGLNVRGYPTNDGGRAAEVAFHDVKVSEGALLGDADEAFGVLERTIDRATAAVSAEALGVMKVLNDLTLEYSKTRKQFGEVIGKFQALQHRLVDMFVALEESRSLLSVYMGDVDSDDTDERSHAVSAMKVQIGKAGRLIGQEAIQLHGGIAMTDEYAAGHYFKRLTVITRLFGDTDWHLDRLATLADKRDNRVA